MCGRFYLDADAAFLMNYFKILYEPKVIVDNPLIFPTQSSPVIIESKGERRMGLMKWGFKLPNSTRPIINSRSETIHEKKMFKDKNKKIGAICAAPYALYKAGVLNKNYTCYPSFEKKIKEDGYFSNKDIVIDDKVITSRGPATAMIFALEIVKILCDEKIYIEVKDGLLVK